MEYAWAISFTILVYSKQSKCLEFFFKYFQHFKKLFAKIFKRFRALVKYNKEMYANLSNIDIDAEIKRYKVKKNKERKNSNF